MKAGYFLIGAVVVAAAYGVGVRQGASATPEPSPPTTARATAATNPAPPLADTGQALPPDHPPIPKDPGSSPQPPGAKKELAGEVKETIAVSGYTYLRIQTDASEVWAAVPTADVKVGDKARVSNAMEMRNFKSSTLKRTFESIYFGNLEGKGSSTASPHPL